MALCNDIYLFRSNPAHYGQLSPRAWSELKQVISEQDIPIGNLHLAAEGKLAEGMGLCELKGVMGSPQFQNISENLRYRLVRNTYANGVEVVVVNDRVISWTGRP